MTGKFYTLEYVPNKLVYVYEVTKEEIKFLAFFNDKGKGMKAVKHSVSKKSKRDFGKPTKCYTPTPQVQQMIDEALQEVKNN